MICLDYTFMQEGAANLIVSEGFQMEDVLINEHEGTLFVPDDPQDHETVLHPSPQERNKIMKAVMDTIAGQFTCYQYDAPKSICFESKEGDLYFWCRVFSDASDFAGEYRDFSYFRLSFNSNHCCLTS